MPMHDWTRVHAGEFHAFHNGWIFTLQTALNHGLLPRGFYALGEQRSEANKPKKTRTLKPDVTAFQQRLSDVVVSDVGAEETGGVAEAPPRVSLREQIGQAELYASLRRTVVIRHVSNDRPVALIEIASPGNKDRRAAASDFVDKCVTALQSGLHVFVVDLHPAGTHDPQGLALTVARAVGSTGSLAPPPDGRVPAVSFEAGDFVTAYAEPFEVGDPLPELPLFYKAGWYVPLPLEQTYAAAFDSLPEHLVERLESR